MHFSDAVEIILKEEGGYVSDPHDPGGETNWGISKRIYPDLDIRNLSREQAIEIYHNDYWDVCRCGDLPSGIALMVFNSAVNQGPGTAACSLQISLGFVRVDGHIGPVTAEAANSVSINWLMTALKHYIKEAYAKCYNYSQYGKQWLERLDRIYFVSKTLD